MNKFYGAHDQWTDLDKQNDVLITSIDGVIDSVKVNGEDYGGGGGGSSDFSTAEVSVENNTEEFINGMFVALRDSPFSAVVSMNTLSSMSKTYNVPLYKGICSWTFNADTIISVSGDIEWNSESRMALITGDCTITIS